MHSPPGRHSSRRLQLAQLTSNFGGGGLEALGVLMAMTAGMASPFSVMAAARCGEDLAHALEFLALVEEIARAEPLGELAVGVGGEVGQHVEVDLGRLAAHRAQHVEAACPRQG